MESAVPALKVTNISKTFGVTTVLDSANLELAPGEIHALVGENGSGKSTLVKILSGYHEPDPGGSIDVAGVPLVVGDPKSTESTGLRFVHQDLGLVASLNCMDNLALGPGYDVGPLRWINWKSQRKVAQAALSRLGYHHIDVRRKVATLSMSERTALAVTRALSQKRGAGSVLILDEPTANLPAPEVQHLFELLKRVQAHGVAILFISHHFNEVFELAQRATVLRDGKVVKTVDVADVTEDQLVELMIGRRLEHAGGAAVAARNAGDQVLTVDGVGGRAVENLVFTASAGEVVGVAGITGSGREAVAGLIGGDEPRTGTIRVNGVAIAPGRPDSMQRAGVSYLPANRVANAILPGNSVRKNITISNLKPFIKGGFLAVAKEKRDSLRLVDDFDVRPRDTEADITTLSGGNQQKVILARVMRLNPRVLILDEPTQGVDVGAQAEIHERIRRAAKSGTAIVVTSSNSEELAEVADRVLLMSKGRIVRELRAPLLPDVITAACLSVSQGSVHE